MTIESIIKPIITPIIKRVISVFQPAQQGLLLWLDGDDTDTITESGGAVSQWDDKSVNGNNVTQSNGPEQPTFLPTGINGKGAIEFVGASAPFLELDSQILSTVDLSALAVFVNTEAIAAGHILASLTNNRQVIRLDPDQGSFGRFQCFDGSTTVQFEFTSSITGTALLLRVEYEFSSNKTIFLNGVQRDFDSYSGDTRIGSLGRLSAAVEMGGRVGEVLVYDRILIQDEVQALENHLTFKWGI